MSEELTNKDDIKISEQEEIVEPSPDEKVGDLIRRERITRRVSIETMSSDLKLSATYIKALEENTYKSLPALPYVKVYLKTIANYLSLDGEILLQQFTNESGFSADEDDDLKSTMKISVQEDKGRNFLVPVISILIIVIALVLLVTTQSTESEVDEEPIDSTTIEMGSEIDTTAVLDSAAIPSISDSIKNDSSIVDPVSTLAVAKTPAVIEVDAEKKSSELNLTVITTRDSSWLTLFVDGKKQYNTLVNHPKTLNFTAKDSININIGVNETIKLLLNDKPLKIWGKGLKIAAIKGDSVEVWSMKQWKNAFKKHL
jgi:cytoskeletal protein RodZ